MKNFKIKDTFSLAWEDSKKNWKFMIGALFVYVVIGFLDGMFGVNQDEVTREVTGSVLFSIISQIVIIYFTAGFMLETIKIVDGKKPCLKTMFAWPVNFVHGLKYFVAYIIYSFLMLTPVMLALSYIIYSVMESGVPTGSLIALGIVALLLTIIIGMFIGFAYYLIVENRNGIFSNIKRSFEMVRGNFWKVLSWHLIILGILILVGVIVGILITIHPIAILIFTVLLIPVILIFMIWVSISYAHLYRKIDPEVTEVVKIDEEDKKNIEV